MDDPLTSKTAASSGESIEPDSLIQALMTSQLFTEDALLDVSSITSPEALRLMSSDVTNHLSPDVSSHSSPLVGSSHVGSTMGCTTDIFLGPAEPLLQLYNLNDGRLAEQLTPRFLTTGINEKRTALTSK